MYRRHIILRAGLLPFASVSVHTCCTGLSPGGKGGTAVTHSLVLDFIVPGLSMGAPVMNTSVEDGRRVCVSECASLGSGTRASPLGPLTMDERLMCGGQFAGHVGGKKVWVLGFGLV